MLVGIDLGTTNSAVAVWQDGAPVLIPNALGDLLTPSAVSVGDDGALLVGLAARERQATHPEATATIFKRRMGTIEEAKLGKRRYRPEELSAMVLRSLKADAEAFLGEAVTGAIVTVPAYFNDRQRKATRRAGELAGLNVERLINEPTAAALAYGIHELEEERPFLVFDLGGGTFDVSLVEIFDGVIEVRASAGDNRLGGEDFNAAIVALAKDALGDALKAKSGEAAMLDEVLRAAAERTRRALSESDRAPFQIVWKGEAHECEVTGEDFEARAQPLIDRLRDPVLRALRDGNVRAEGLSEIVMVGGATRMPLVRRAVTRMFGRFPNATINPDHAIALGAAVQAGLKSRDAALKEIRLTDVCPFTLGVDTGHRDATGKITTGLFSPIIERNTVIPASRSEVYSPLDAAQQSVTFGIYQGESRFVAQNVKLGQLEVPLPQGHRGHIGIDVRFTYDVSGLLEVDVEVPGTGMRRQLVIRDEEDRESDADFAKRRKALEALKIHPRDEAANAATLARANQLFENRLGYERQVVGEWIAQFESVLAGQDPRAIETARTELDKAIDGMDGEQFL
ncbi:MULTISPECIES: Hsp70 family protein [unclassified Sphingopyxis]|uniref:Hsp70 family protein n=1 Tax=unclassified Sphingopyxis TaxID=2614943 RepID=UPI000737109B|nr:MULTISPECIES: molecular chaperone HscC [unclassified Sphingopyxis]KTE43019.1 molecular chaperone HscC [Sphingopyxis sp. HIX]KTE72587.1 molecular chaperone HscC [Sphingopyxis sp. HXXIV]